MTNTVHERTFDVTIEVAAGAEGPFEAIEALVGGGATYALLPGPQLEWLSLASRERRVLIHADGTDHEHELGTAWLRLSEPPDCVGPVVVVVGPADGEPRLGTVTLSELAVEVDTATQTLRRGTAYLPSFWPVTP